jgi:serine/threonine protein kinase
MLAPKASTPAASPPCVCAAWECGAQISELQSVRVFAGRTVDGARECDIAIKFATSGRSDGASESLEKEAELYLACGHRAPELAPCLGLCKCVPGVSKLYMMAAREDVFSMLEKQDEHRLPESTVACIASSVAKAWLLLYATTGFAHHDIKPENILAYGGHEYKLCDLGLAVDASSDTRGTKQLVGPATLTYAAPEAQGYNRNNAAFDMSSLDGTLCNPYDVCAADCWSLGLTLLVCLTGRFPSWYTYLNGRVTFGGVQYGPWQAECRSREEPRLRQLLFPEEPAVSWSCVQAVAALLHMDPAERLTMAGLLAHPWLSAHMS